MNKQDLKERVAILIVQRMYGGASPSRRRSTVLHMLETRFHEVKCG